MELVIMRVILTAFVTEARVKPSLNVTANILLKDSTNNITNINNLKSAFLRE